MRGRWLRAGPSTRANHGVDNDRIEVHANPAWGWLTLIVERRSICRHEVAYRVHENCFSPSVFSTPAVHPFHSSFIARPCRSKRGEGVRFHATETLIVITLRRLRSRRNRIWNPACARAKSAGVFSLPLPFSSSHTHTSHAHFTFARRKLSCRFTSSRPTKLATVVFSQSRLNYYHDIYNSAIESDEM